MNERRKHQAECGAAESMFVHREKRRSFHESTAYTLLPPRRLSSRDTELLGLQVQGFCCPLQPRPSSWRIAHRVTPQSRGGGDRSLTLLGGLEGRMESRAKPASRSRTGGRPEKNTEVGASSVSHHRDRDVEAAETPTPPCNDERQPSAAKVSELHLYLPSSLCDDEEQDAGTQETRSSEEETSARRSEVKPNEAHCPMVPNPSQTREEQPGCNTPQPSI